VLQAGAWADLRRVAEALGLPVMTTLAGKSAFPEDHPLALGTGGHSSTPMSDRHLAAADLIVAIGTGLTRSHYTSHVPAGKRVIQIVRDPRELSESYPSSTSSPATSTSCWRRWPRRRRPRARRRARAAAKLVAEQRAAFLAEWGGRLTADAEPISPYRVIGTLMTVADRARTVVTHDSGNPRDQVVPFYEALTPLGYWAGARARRWARASASPWGRSSPGPTGCRSTSWGIRASAWWGSTWRRGCAAASRC
jgi:acetolactate synthase-1/2/3 large subunit